MSANEIVFTRFSDGWRLLLEAAGNGMVVAIRPRGTEYEAPYPLDRHEVRALRDALTKWLGEGHATLRGVTERAALEGEVVPAWIDGIGLREIVAPRTMHVGEEFTVTFS